MGYGVLHQPNASRRIGAIFARSKNSGCCGEKIGVVECGLFWDVRRVLSDLLYLKIRRGTQVAQGRGLQNLHSWVRIPPAPPIFLVCFPFFTASSSASVPDLYLAFFA